MIRSGWIFVGGVAGLLLLAADTMAQDSLLPQTAPTVSRQDWPWWRGPRRNGHAPGNQQPPLKWSAQRNVIWKAPLPGRGHSSPIVVGDEVFLATAEEDKQIQSVICLDRNFGTQRWITPVHEGDFVFEGNDKSSQASSTVACDGERLFINFLNNNMVYTTALDRKDGRPLWQTPIHKYKVHQGYASSPFLYGKLVIVSADNKGEGGGAIVALDRNSGKEVWRQPRPQEPNYASPIVIHSAGMDQLIMIGCDHIASHLPLTGKQLWNIEGATTECVTSPVSDGQLVFSSGGYPKNHVAAVRMDGSGDVVWENNTRVYVPSLILRDGYLYATADAGVAMCWNAKNGKEMWKGRLGGTFSASPVVMDDLLYATNEEGQTFIFKAQPGEFELVAENELGTEVFATPAICGSRIYMRVAQYDGDQRQEWLYCLGNGTAQ